MRASASFTVLLSKQYVLKIDIHVLCCRSPEKVEVDKQGQVLRMRLMRHVSQTWRGEKNGLRGEEQHRGGKAQGLQ